MPLVDCPECSNQISDLAESCPHCGYALGRDAPDLEAKIKYKAKTGSGGCLIALIGLVCLFYFPIGTIIGILLILIGNSWASYYACGNCGNEVKNDATLCPGCHAKLRKRRLFGI